MKALRLIHRIRIAFGASLLFAAFVLVIMYANMREGKKESEQVRITLERLDHLQNVLVKVNTIESGQRGYVISGDTNFLSGYSKAISTLDSDLIALSAPSLNKDASAADVKNLIGLVNRKTGHVKLVVETRKYSGYDSAASHVQSGTGKELTDSILTAAAVIDQKERNYLERTNADRASNANVFSGLFFLLGALFFISTIGGYLFIFNEYKKSERANRILTYNTTLLKNISDAIITTDKYYKITDWNVHAEKLFGYTAVEVRGKQLNSVLHLQFLNLDIDSAKALLIKNEMWKGEVMQYHKDGTAVHADVSTSVLKSDSGDFIGTINVIRDITRRVKLEDNLKRLSSDLQQQVNIKSNELSLFFDRIADAFIAVDNDWNYTYLNKAALDFHGKEGDELIGKNMWELFPDVVKEPFYEAIQEAKKTQQPQRKELYSSTHDKWFEDLIYPGKDGISVYYRDITEKKKAEMQLKVSEEALKFSNERFELVAKATNDAIWDWDMATDTLTGNESFCIMMGIGPGTKVKYEDFNNKVHPDDRERMKNNFKAKLKQRESVLTEEFLFADRDGSYKVIYDRGYILYNAENRGYRMLGAMQDITEMKEVGRKLLLQKELSDTVINSLPGIFYIYNKHGQFYVWNKNFATVSGYSDEEIHKMNPIEFFDDEEKPLLMEKIGNVFISGSDNVEAHFLTKNGKKIPYYFTGMLINYENEECLMGVGLDISEKVRSQKELVTSEEKFRTLVQQASDGITITDEDGNFIDVNTSFALLTGYSKDELLGMTAYKVFRDHDSITRPFRYNEMSRGMVVLSERMITKKNGKLVNVEISAKQLPDGNFQGITRDITERKQVEEALRLSEKKYRLLFNENPLPMWILSLPERNFMDVNSAAVISYGYSKTEFLRMTALDINPNINLPLQPEDAKDGTLRHQGVWDHHTKDGTIIKVNVIAHNIVYEGVPAILVLANDITDKFLAEENLQRSHEELRELASHLETIRETERTHMAREIHDELGQQLTGLKMDITWLGRRIKSDDDAIKQKLKDTVELIDKTVITVRRIATELRPSILDDLGLVAAMEWQSDEFQGRSEIKAVFTSNVTNIKVSPEIATGIFRIFQESLTNVLRHSGATEVVSSFFSEDDKLTLEIRDNGIGFDEQKVASKKTLGLLGMKERVLLINGTYDINGRPGKGTSVIITVPLS